MYEYASAVSAAGPNLVDAMLSALLLAKNKHYCL